RNGVRLIVYGRGDRLELRDIPLSAGVEVGDEIVTSGLGGRFPAGFPVGKILKLRPDDTHAFLVGELEPAAKLDRGRNVLLLRSVPALPQLPDSNAGESAPEATAAGGPSMAPVNRMGAAAAVVPAAGNATNPPAAAATQAPSRTPASEPAAAGPAPAPATTPATEPTRPAAPASADNPTPTQVRP
ncbi:MAG: rod shape-determining protein MreC, partial [Stenotrophomonas sp.]